MPQEDASTDKNEEDGGDDDDTGGKKKVVKKKASKKKADKWRKTIKRDNKTSDCWRAYDARGVDDEFLYRHIDVNSTA